MRRVVLDASAAVALVTGRHPAAEHAKFLKVIRPELLRLMALGAQVELEPFTDG